MLSREDEEDEFWEGAGTPVIKGAENDEDEFCEGAGTPVMKGAENEDDEFCDGAGTPVMNGSENEVPDVITAGEEDAEAVEPVLVDGFCRLQEDTRWCKRLAADCFAIE